MFLGLFRRTKPSQNLLNQNQGEPEAGKNLLKIHIFNLRPRPTPRRTSEQLETRRKHVRSQLKLQYRCNGTRDSGFLYC
jgi:hypothetical protein